MRHRKTANSVNPGLNKVGEPAIKHFTRVINPMLAY